MKFDQFSDVSSSSAAPIPNPISKTKRKAPQNNRILYKRSTDIKIVNNCLPKEYYVKEVPEKREAFDDDDNVVEVSEYFARPMRVILFKNGNYAYESTRGVSGKDAIDYLVEPFDVEYDRTLREKLTLDEMRSFYKSKKEIRKLKVSEIGKKEPNPSWPEEDIKEIIEDAGGDTENSIFSVGRSMDKNLKNVDIINRGFARLSELNFIRSRDASDEIEEIRDSARYAFTYSSDMEEDEQSRFIKNKLERIIRNLFNDDGDN